MDNAIESLKSQISTSKERIKSLTSSTSLPFSFDDTALNSLTTSLQTSDIQTRITELENEVPPHNLNLIADHPSRRGSQSIEIGYHHSSYKRRT